MQPVADFCKASNFTFPPACWVYVNSFTGALSEDDCNTMMTLAGLLKGLGLRNLRDVSKLDVAEAVLAWVAGRDGGAQSGYKYTRACG